MKDILVRTPKEFLAARETPTLKVYLLYDETSRVATRMVIELSLTWKKIWPRGDFVSRIEEADRAAILLLPDAQEVLALILEHGFHGEVAHQDRTGRHTADGALLIVAVVTRWEARAPNARPDHLAGAGGVEGSRSLEKLGRPQEEQQRSV